MPLRRSRSYYMRNRATLSTPPICRSKATTVTSIRWSYCPTLGQPHTLYRYGLTLPQAQALVPPLRPSRGTLFFDDKTNGQQYNDSWDDCAEKFGPYTPHAWTSGWVSPAFIEAEDDQCANHPMSPGGSTIPAVWSAFNAAIPLDRTVTGIEFQIRQQKVPDFSTIRDTLIQPGIVGGSPGSNLATGAAVPPALTFATYGGPGNLAGMTVTAADINSPDFSITTQYTRDPTPPPQPISIFLDVIYLYIYAPA